MRQPAIKSKPAPARAPAPGTAQPRIPVWLLAGLLVLVTIAFYWPTMSHDFVNYDDNLVVTSNVHVQNGLTLENVKWAFFNPVNSIWHPLTVMSHMLDCQLFGLKPWGHHLTSVLLHALNAALVFLLLNQMLGLRHDDPQQPHDSASLKVSKAANAAITATAPQAGAVWRSLLVAALFAVHPLHVESVAWVSERKDVLSAFFGLLSLIFYVRYAQTKQTLNSQPSTLNYFLALFFFALGLMSKPMLVTWPFVLLLLDYWPLKRSSEFRVQSSDSKNGPQPSTARRGEAERRRLNPQLLTLLWEKLPFFALATVASVVTFVVQKLGGAVMSGGNLPLGARVGNALVSYCRYLGKLFWPTDLAVFYPHPGYWPLEQVLLAGGFMVSVSVLLFVKRRRYPFLLVGWLWYCGTLVPVIGLVQVGGQAMADRYAYLPSLGVLVLAVWGANELTRHWRYGVMALSVAGSAAIVVCLAFTHQQLGYWQDSETLFRHALAVTENNYLAHNNLGDALDRKGQTDEAISQYEEAIRLKPDYAEAHYNLGIALDRKGQTDEAISQYQEAIRLKPDYAKAHNNLGFALDQEAQSDEAISQYQEAIRLKPDFAEAHNNLGIALDQKGKIDEAINQYQEAIHLKPDYAEAHNNLGTALAANGRFDEAIENFHKAIQIHPNSSEALNNLGSALAAKGQFDEAIEKYRQAIQINPNRPETFVHLGMTLSQLGRNREAIAQYREALRLNPNLAAALNNLAWALAAGPDDSLRSGAEAVRLAERACELTHYGQPLFIGTLAAAYAECGRFPEAVTMAEKAEQLATSAGLTAVAEKNRQLLELYRAGKPYHEPAPTRQ